MNGGDTVRGTHAAPVQCAHRQNMCSTYWQNLRPRGSHDHDQIQQSRAWRQIAGNLRSSPVGAESLVQKMESGQVPLDELLAGYQRGAALLALCKEKLSAVEEQIKLLETSPQGALVTKPWDEGEA